MCAQANNLVCKAIIGALQFIAAERIEWHTFDALLDIVFDDAL